MAATIESDLNESMALWRRFVSLTAHRVRDSLAPLLDSRLAGDLRSRRLVPRGPEPETPRTLGVDDDIEWLDFRRADGLARVPLPVALQNGWLRTIPARQDIQGECVTIVDLSRSMLSGCLQELPPADVHSPVGSKIGLLLLAACAVQSLAEGTGLSLRAVCIRRGGGVIDVLKSPRPQAFGLRLLDKLEVHLTDLFRSSQLPRGEWPEPQTTLRQGLQHVLRDVRGRGVVVMVSDFLEPLPSYRSPLLDAMSRHKTLFVDVSSPADIDYPEEMADAAPVWEGARHLEAGMAQYPNRKADILDWNAFTKKNRRELDLLIRGQARRTVIGRRSATEIFRQLRVGLKSLR